MNKLVKICLSAVFFLSLYSCGTYQISTKNRVKIEKILTVTSTGDTLAVPLRDFQRYNYDSFDFNFTRFNYGLYNNYWNIWSYPYFGWPNRGFNWNYRNWYVNPPIYNYSPPKVQPKIYIKGRRGSENLNLNRGRNNNETIRINPRSNNQTEGRNNGRRSWSRENLSPKPVVPRLSNPVQPGQIRRGSRPPVLQQPRSSQPPSQQRRGTGSGRQN